MECLSCYLSKHNVFKIKERTRSVSYHKSTITCILFTHTTQKSRSIMRKFKRLISKFRSKDRAISSLKMSKFDISPWKNIMNLITNKRKRSSIKLRSSKKKSFKILSSSGHNILEQLNQIMYTLNWKSSTCFWYPTVTAIIGLTFFWISKFETGVYLYWFWSNSDVVLLAIVLIIIVI